MVVDDTVPSPDSKGTSTDAPSGQESNIPSVPDLHIRLSKIAFQDQVVLENLSLTLEAGQITCLLGPSGVGKTSVLKSIAGFIPLAKGSEIRAADQQPLTGRIAYMDQNDLLLPWATVLENVVIAARLNGSAPDLVRARHLIEQVGLTPKINDRPDTLSGGMRQRVALARTLMNDSPIILVDEPFSALDAITRHRLQALMAELLKDRTVLMITHDPLEALRVAHQVYVLAGDPVLLSPPLHMEGQVPRIPTDPGLQPRLQLILSMLGMTREDGK